MYTGQLDIGEGSVPTFVSTAQFLRFLDSFQTINMVSHLAVQNINIHVYSLKRVLVGRYPQRCTARWLVRSAFVKQQGYASCTSTIAERECHVEHLKY